MWGLLWFSPVLLNLCLIYGMVRGLQMNLPAQDDYQFVAALPVGLLTSLPIFILSCLCSLKYLGKTTADDRKMLIRAFLFGAGAGMLANVLILIPREDVVGANIGLIFSPLLCGLAIAAGYVLGQRRPL